MNFIVMVNTIFKQSSHNKAQLPISQFYRMLQYQIDIYRLFVKNNQNIWGIWFATFTATSLVNQVSNVI
jgi:hypothetical protein